MTAETVESKIVRIQANHENIVNIINKLDSTLTKISEVSADIASMLAVHEQRLEAMEKKEREIVADKKACKIEIDSDIERLHVRIDTVREDIHKEMADGFEKLRESFDALRVSNETYRTKVDNKYRQVEKFMWLLIGGGAVVGFVIARFATVIYHYFVK